MGNNFLEQLNETSPKIKQKPWYKNLKIIIPLAIIVIAGGIYATKNSDSGEVAGEKIINSPKKVGTIILDSQTQNQDTIKTSGVVRADSQITITAQTNGDTANIFFSVGDTVNAGDILASLHNNSLLTNLNNAQISYNNALQSLNAVKASAEESVKQAEIGVKNAEENIISAEISLKTAGDNMANAIALQEKNNNDVKDNAVVSFSNFLNTVYTALDQINYILKIEGSAQLPGITPTLGILNIQSLTDAKQSYTVLNSEYENLAKQNVSATNIKNMTSNAIKLLAQAKKTVDDTIEVLDNTITNSNFSDSALMSQRSSFANLRSNIVASQNSANLTLHGLENIALSDKKETDSLKNAVEQAENRLDLARVSYDNAVSTLNRAKQSKEQQIISAQSGVDSASGQLEIVQSQVSDLTIESPISGEITRKYIETGGQLSPGQKIAEISQTGLVKIEIELASEDIYRIKTGQQAMINGMFEGVISHIDPVADPTSKKVGVEIAFENANKELIPETFVDIAIPLSASQNFNLQTGSFFVPVSSVTITQTENYVFVVKNGKAVKREVVAGETEGDKIKIIAGLADEDELIIQGNRNLEGGEDVTISN